MRYNETTTIEDPSGKEGKFPCADCGRQTNHVILTIATSNFWDESGYVQYWDHNLTVKCKGCSAISFCKISKCSEVEDYLNDGTPFLVQERKHFPEIEDLDQGMFVNTARIDAISSLQHRKFDYTKLSQLMTEINLTYSLRSYCACAILIRAILDHVPPIFGAKSFAEVANNYPGGRSFSDSMKHLEGMSRKLADGILHTQIRSKESLPTIQQVDCRAGLDALLGEIVRIS